MILLNNEPTLNFKTAFLLIILVVFLSFLASGCNVKNSTKKNKVNVVLIVVDALRPDHLGSYGYQKNTSPNIDRLADEATLFKTCVTPYPRTTPSAVSLATGMYPHTHGTRSLFTKTNNFESLDNLNLAEVLQSNGYQTAAFLHENLLHPNSGYQQGFLTYVNLKKDSAVTQKAINWLEHRKDKNEPFFMQLWYYELHWAYYPPAEDLALFSKKSKRDLLAVLNKGKEIGVDKLFFTKIYTPEEMEFLISAYDGAIHAADREIGRFIDYLKRTGQYDNTLIVFTSDHGESLGEHDYYFDHGEYYYDVSALVPLIIKRPQQNKKEVIDYQTRNIDVFPTVLGMLDIDHTSEGKNLFPGNLKEKEQLKTLLAFGESGNKIYKHNERRYLEGIAGKWRIARSNTGKLIFIPHPKKRIFEFYDIKNDLYEANNLIDDPAYEKEIEYLKSELFKWIKKEDLVNTDQIAKNQIDKDMRKRLRSVGYLQ